MAELTLREALGKLDGDALVYELLKPDGSPDGVRAAQSMLCRNVGTVPAVAAVGTECAAQVAEMIGGSDAAIATVSRLTGAQSAILALVRMLETHELEEATP